MTKSDIIYSAIPNVTPAGSSTEPHVEGFAVGESHAVTVIVDEHRGSNQHHHASDALLVGGSRRPIELNMCPKCHQACRTSTRTYPSAVTWVSVVVTAAVFFPLCWIPLIVDPMKQTDHFCQSCGKKIGSVKALEGCFVKERI